MEKLVELLNEFEIEKPARDYTRRIEKQNKIRMCWTEYTWAYVDDEEAERIIISKKYKFIEWLVNEDKIDNSKFYDKNILKWFMTLTNKEKADSIIMNLSIQDKPIEFLISVLK